MENRDLAIKISNIIFKNSKLQQDSMDHFVEIIKSSANNDHFVDNCYRKFPELR